MHPWHDVYIDEKLIAETCPVIIEVPKGSKNKYELDKQTGLLKLDRVLYSAVHYPADYGFVPRSYCDDGDPLDALVLSQVPMVPLCLVEARPVAVMRMRDDKGLDDKIICVNACDPAFETVRDITDLSQHLLREIKRFFQDYKVLENKEVVVDDFLGLEDTHRVIREALELYKKLRRGEIS